MQELERRAGIRVDDEEPSPLPTRGSAPSPNRFDDTRSESGFSAVSGRSGSSRMDARLIAERYKNKKARQNK